MCFVSLTICRFDFGKEIIEKYYTTSKTVVKTKNDFFVRLFDNMSCIYYNNQNKRQFISKHCV